MILWDFFKAFKYLLKFPSKSLKSPKLLNKMFSKQMFPNENYEWCTTANAQNDQGWKYNMKQINLQQMENEYIQK